ncbi:MAG: DDE-type integrase/transposase/recombinase [Candidatus Bathyarchaeia archaeon]
MKLSRRELRGLGILTIGGMIRKENKNSYIVKSETQPAVFYKVEWTEGKWICNCPDYSKRGKTCKHIYAVNFLLDFPRIILSNSTAFDRHCPHCYSANVRPKGFRYNQTGPVRMFKCKDCGKRFADNTNVEYSGAKAALAVIAADLYFKGLSLRDIQNHFWQVYNINKPAATIHRWIIKITRALKEALKDVKLEVGDKWLADETIIKVNGEVTYLWNIMDFETRCYIASLLTSTRNAEDALAVIKIAIKNCGKTPKSLVTDGLKSYAKALEALNIPIEHVSNVGIAKYENNNRLERLHGAIKQWAMSKRGLKNQTCLLLEGYRLYHNNIKPKIAAGKSGVIRKQAEKWQSILLKESKISKDLNVKKESG